MGASTGTTDPPAGGVGPIAADGLLICTPEYIHSLPAVLKNLLEWVVSSGEGLGKPAAVWSASPSLEGGARAHAALVHILEVMSVRVVPEASLCLTLARSGLDVAGQLRNPAQTAALRAALDWLAAAGEAT